MIPPRLHLLLPWQFNFQRRRDGGDRISEVGQETEETTSVAFQPPIGSILRFSIPHTIY